jgi:hypothetical protein
MRKYLKLGIPAYSQNKRIYNATDLSSETPLSDLFQIDPCIERKE